MRTPLNSNNWYFIYGISIFHGWPSRCQWIAMGISASRGTHDGHPRHLFPTTTIPQESRHLLLQALDCVCVCGGGVPNISSLDKDRLEQICSLRIISSEIFSRSISTQLHITISRSVSRLLRRCGIEWDDDRLVVLLVGLGNGSAQAWTKLFNRSVGLGLSSVWYGSSRTEPISSQLRLKRFEHTRFRNRFGSSLETPKLVKPTLNRFRTEALFGSPAAAAGF